ncbi:unnamed protein product, partial [Closterium sp. NIES-53]
DAAESNEDLGMVDKVVRTVATLLGNSSMCSQRFKYLERVIYQTNLEVQGIHTVRWLSRGDVVRRLCKVLGACIVLLWEHNHKAYEIVTCYKFQFCLFFLADILADMNDLNRCFQRREEMAQPHPAVACAGCASPLHRGVQEGVLQAEHHQVLSAWSALQRASGGADADIAPEVRDRMAGVSKSMRRRRPVKSLKLAVAKRERKGKHKEGEAVAAGTAGENEDEGEEEEEDDEVEQDLGDNQEVVEEEDNSFLSDDEDVEEVYFIDKPSPGRRPKKRRSVLPPATAACRLDYATALIAEFESAIPPSVGSESALGTDVLGDRQEDFECLAVAVPRFASMLLAPEGDPDAPDIPTPRSYAEAITGPFSSQWQATMDAEMASWKSTGTYVNAVPPSRVNIVDGMRIFRVKRPRGSPPALKARYVARGFSKRHGRDYELHSLDFSTVFLQGSLHEEIWLRRPLGFTESFPAGTQWNLQRPVYGLRQAPREWHDTLMTTLAALGFALATANPSLFLRTDTLLPPFYVLVYVDDLVFASADTEALTHLKSELQKYFNASASNSPHHSPLLCLPAIRSQLHLHYVALGRHRKVHWDAAKRVLHYLCSTSGMGLLLGGRGLVVLTGHVDASWVDDSATQQWSQGYTFSLGSGFVSWRSTRSSSVLRSSCEAEIYVRAMASQELRWLTYLLSDLGEQPCSPPVLYVENKAMIALYQEHRLEHQTKHIALRYFLARDLQQRGQLCLAYVATRANTADIFTKALLLGDHQRFSTVLGLNLIVLTFV